MSIRPNVQMRAYAAALAIVAIVLTAACAIFGAPPLTRGDVVAIVVLGSFAALATMFDVDVQTRVGLSGNAMFLVAALVVFREDHQYLGVAIVAVLGALDYVQLRDRDFAKSVANAAGGTIALIAAAGATWAIAPGATVSAPVLLLAGALGAVVYFALEVVLYSLGISILRGDPYVVVARELATYDISAYPFAVIGLGLGWVYLELGPIVVPLLGVPILIARSTFANYLELRAAQEQTIQTLILALEAKDRYTAGHAQRVATFCEYVGEELGFGPSRMERLRYAALMHDIGKLIVPNQLLNKPGRLTESEFARVRRHEGVSVELLRRIDFLAPIAGDTTTEAATAAVDGPGLVEPAIIHVADAFDAMTSTRSYRKALSQETAFSELRAGAGSQFNSECVEALIRAIEARGEQYGAGFEVDVHEWDVVPPEAGTGSAGLGDVLPDDRHGDGRAATTAHAPERATKP